MGFLIGRGRTARETYPSAAKLVVSTGGLVETASGFAAGPTTIAPSGFATIVGGPISFTIPAGGGRVILSASANISGAAAQLVSLQLQIDGGSVMQNNVTSSGASAQESPGMAFRSAPLSAGTHTADLQATTAGGSDMSAANGSLVIEIVNV